MKRFGEKPVGMIPAHVVRPVDLVLVREPYELVCQCGLELPRRSAVPMPAVLGLTDGYRGYCPKAAGIHGIGCSADPIYWSRFPAATGGRSVDGGSSLLHRLCGRGSG
jgi:hypothetical protein